MKPDNHQQQFGGTPADTSVRGVRGWELYRAGAYNRDDKCLVCQLYWNRFLITGIQGYHWVPGENIATCGYYRCPSVASPDCVCGFYAYWEMDEWLTAISGHRIIGVIEGYGDITLGTKGFRCSKARVLAMRLPSNYLDFGVEQLYSDTQIFSSIEAMLAEFPTTGVDDGFRKRSA